MQLLLRQMWKLVQNGVRYFAAACQLERSRFVVVAAMLVFASLSAFMPAKAAAYGALSNRSVLMSSTANSATNVAYQVGFTTVTNNQTIGSVVIMFCSNSPIIGDTCSIASGFDTHYATLTVGSVTGNITGLSVDTTHSTSNKVVLTRTAGTVANGAVSLTLGNGTTNGLTNPATDNTTFYAKIITLSNTTGDLSGGESIVAQDAGGVALSTANQLNVTAKVQETLTFCVYTDVDCATGGTAVALGDANGVLINTATTYTGNAYYDLASNAFGGVSVRVKGDTLKSGSFSITPHGASCTADSVATGVEQFGLRISTVGADQTATAPYDCASGHHGFDVTNTNTVYGQEIGQTAGANDVSTSEIELAAKSAGTTEAGLYTTTLTLVATATY